MQIVLGEDFGEPGVFREKAVAGMHRVRAVISQAASSAGTLR
jgi:hypothetical protein